VGKAAILLVTGFLAIIGFTLNQIQESSSSSVENLSSSFQRTVARNCANSAVNVAVSQLSNGQNVSIYSNLSALDGHASLDTFNLGGTL